MATAIEAAWLAASSGAIRSCGAARGALANFLTPGLLGKKILYDELLLMRGARPGVREGVGVLVPRRARVALEPLDPDIGAGAGEAVRRLHEVEILNALPAGAGPTLR